MKSEEINNQLLKIVVVAKIIGTDILASQVELGLAPIKPICEAFGIASNGQIEKLKENHIKSAVNLRIFCSTACFCTLPIKEINSNAACPDCLTIWFSIEVLPILC